MRSYALLLALAWGAALCPAEAQSPYAQIPSLNYQTDDARNGSPASCFAAIMQVQQWLDRGVDVPLSQRYLRIKADLSDGYKWPNTGPIATGHGFSSPALGWQMSNSYGSCPLSMCSGSKFKTNASMDQAALPNRVGGLLTLNEVPNYDVALSLMRGLPGACVYLSTDGYEAYAIVGVDEQGRGIWLDFYHGKNGKPLILFLPSAEGQALWDGMIQGNWYTPANYMVVVLPL